MKIDDFEEKMKKIICFYMNLMIFEAAGTGAEIQDPRGSIFNSDSLLKSDDFGGVLEHLWGGPHSHMYVCMYVCRVCMVSKNPYVCMVCMYGMVWYGMVCMVSKKAKSANLDDLIAGNCVPLKTLKRMRGWENERIRGMIE